MLANWVQETTATTGTGAITLGGAFSDAFVAYADQFDDGEEVYYVIEDGNNRESGIGTLSASGATLTRTTVLETLVSGVLDNTSPAAISLSGSAIVTCADLEQMHGIHPEQTSSNYKYAAMAGAMGDSAGAESLVSGNLHAVPLRIDIAGFYDAIMIQISVAQTGTLRVGLATVNRDLSIGSYLAESADVDTSTTGDKVATFTSKFLHIGDYYMILFSNTIADVPMRDRRHMGAQNFVGRQGTQQRAVASLLATSVVSPPTFPVTPPALTTVANAPDMMLRRSV